MGAVKRFEIWLSMTSFGTWVIKKFSAHVDPFVFRLTGGRFTSLGPVVIPQLLLTTTGRKSGQPREAQLVYTDVDGVIHIVASNFGGERHPAWSYNLMENPRASVQVKSEKMEVIAEQLTDAEKESVWARLVDNIPNYSAYRQRTDRNLKVYRLIACTD
ncbi:MAG: nitroreductase family deazaflavin-dependent oxidoreductase [Haliea sp.]|jgi:deazaflavin-dependent oxidoreductase (nitroreductase family)|nr:nitroreductase family deazaflavin-dependent oxidoreductase [Haliea sp.]